MKCRTITHTKPSVHRMGRIARGLGVLIVLTVELSTTAGRAFGQTASYDLCIEQSPPRAGIVWPDSGTHRFAADSIVVVSAEPQPGYQFAYWLGDVADPKARSTTVQINTSKMIVAVFRLTDEDQMQQVGAGGGGGALSPTAIDLSTPGWSVSGGGKSTTTTIIVPVIPTPEPTTVVLLALGALALRRRRPQHT